MAKPAAGGAGCVLIGIGNPDRGDDAAGRQVARAVHGHFPDRDVQECDGEVTHLLDQLARADTAILVDASCSGCEPGTTRRFDVTELPLPPTRDSLSTHGLGVAEAIELARALGRLPRPCVVYAIEGASFEPGTPLSPAVSRAVTDLGRQLGRSVKSRDL